MSQIVQIIGALAILAAFAAAQARVVGVRSWSYLWLNFVGSFVLAVDAWHEEQWGILGLSERLLGAGHGSAARRAADHAA